MFIFLCHGQTNGKHGRRSSNPDPAGLIGCRALGSIQVKSEIISGHLPAAPGGPAGIVIPCCTGGFRRSGFCLAAGKLAREISRSIIRGIRWIEALSLIHI